MDVSGGSLGTWGRGLGEPNAARPGGKSKRLGTTRWKKRKQKLKNALWGDTRTKREKFKPKKRDSTGWGGQKGRPALIKKRENVMRKILNGGGGKTSKRTWDGGGGFHLRGKGN